MVARLRVFEGWRCLWRVPVAMLAFVLPALIFIAAALLAAFIAGNDFDVLTSVVAAVVLGVTGLLSTRLRGRRLHRALIERRLLMWELPNPPTQVPILVRSGDVDAAQAALRRAAFNPGRYLLNIGTPPSDAQDLTVQLNVYEPAAWPQSSSDDDRTRRMARALERVGLRARVGGIDVLRDDGDRTEPVTVMGTARQAPGGA
jgi:hypothetical protein